MSIAPCTVCRSILHTDNLNECAACGSLHCDQCPANVCRCVHDDAVIEAARTHLRDSHTHFHDLRVKQGAQGLTAAEGQDLQVLGLACVRVRQVVDALLDAADGVFSEPFPYAPYVA